MSRLTTRNPRVRISKAPRCLILCASSTVSACTPDISLVTPHPTVASECRNSWPKISSNRFPPVLRSRSRINPSLTSDFRRKFAVERSTSGELLERVAQPKAIARKLEQIGAQRAAVKFSHVIAPAQAFLAAVVARHVQKTVWILCPSVRAQDSLYETILNWLPAAQFLPEAEFAAVENVLPDPEIAAERLALLAKIDPRSAAADSENASHMIVTTRASLDQPAPKRGAVSSATLTIKR